MGPITIDDWLRAPTWRAALGTHIGPPDPGAGRDRARRFGQIYFFSTTILL